MRVSRSACVLPQFVLLKSKTKHDGKALLWEITYIVFHFCTCLWFKINWKCCVNRVLFIEGKAFSVFRAFMDLPQFIERQFIEWQFIEMTICRMAVYQTILYQTSRQFIEQPFMETIVYRTDSYVLLSFVIDIHKTLQSHFCSPSHLKWIPFLSYFRITCNCSLHCCSDLWFSLFWLPLTTSRYQRKIKADFALG